MTQPDNRLEAVRRDVVGRREFIGVGHPVVFPVADAIVFRDVLLVCPSAVSPTHGKQNNTQGVGGSNLRIIALTETEGAGAGFPA